MDTGLTDSVRSFVFLGRVIAKARVPTDPVVEGRDVVEDGQPGRLAGRVAVVVHPLRLEAVEEALGHRVVQAGTRPTRAARRCGIWLTLVAFLGLVGMQLVYWLVTHPVNRYWLQGEKLSSLGSGFFSLASASGSRRQGETRSVSWTVLRDRWEYWHLTRAILVLVSLVALVIAL